MTQTPTTELLSVVRAMRDYIDALPSDVVASLPTMPGFDRDWADEVIEAANLEAQPVASKCDQDVYANGTSACLVVIPKETAEVICRGISAVTGCKVDWHYTGRRVHIKAIALPAPALPDDYQHLKNVQELYHKQEDRLFSLAQRIKGSSFDKYSHVPSQAVDVLEREIFGEDGDACRAAMLAAASEGGKQ